MRSLYLLSVVASLLLLLTPVPLTAAAQSLEQLRASGAVGERFDGYVEVRDSSASGAMATAQEVNAKRQKIYSERATKDGATPEAVGQIYAKQILNKAPPGTWFLRPDGTWVQK